MVEAIGQRAAGAPNGAAGAEEAFLKVRGLTCSYSGVVAVRDLSLHVGRGEIVALLGANGAGKTTAVKAIAGIHKPDRGEICIDGQRADGEESYQIIRRGVTLVPEGRRVFSQMSVQENLRLGGYINRDRAALSKRLEAILELFPRLAERFDQQVGLMSGGEQQMVAIARGLMSGPRLLILDEPSLGLMPTMVDKVFSLVRDIVGSGIGVLLVEQNARQSLAVANRAYILEKGVAVLEGKGSDLANDSYIKKAFLGL